VLVKITRKHLNLRYSLEIGIERCPKCGEYLKAFTYPDGRVEIFTNEDGRTPDLSCCKELQGENK